MVSSSSTVKFESEEVIDRFLDNVDVWKMIFEMLEVKDRIRVEMTNKRLGMMMSEYWKRFTSFDTQCELKSNSFSMSCNPVKLSAAFVHICVKRIGDRLRSLTIREKFFPSTVWRSTLPSIGEGCPNVETINFVFDGVDRTLDIRLDSFSRLKTLTVRTAGRPHDFPEALASMFLSIPTSIEVIRGLAGKREEPFENGAQIEGFFADRRSLREICLKGLYTRDESQADIFRVIAERCSHLKSIKLSSCCIDFHGVIALESVKQLDIYDAVLNEMEIVTICERSPLVENLKLHCRFSSNFHLQSAALGSLTKLAELHLRIAYEDENVLAPSLVTEFVRELTRNLGASLRRLDLPSRMSLPTAAIEALANGCAKLRRVEFYVRVGEATPASIRFIIGCIVAHPSWIPQTGEPTLVIDIRVIDDGGDGSRAVRAAFKALAAPAANLPSGVGYGRYNSCQKWSQLTPEILMGAAYYR